MPKFEIGDTVLYLGVHWMVAENEKWSGFQDTGKMVPFLRLERINPSGAYETVKPASFDLVFHATDCLKIVSE